MAIITERDIETNGIRLHTWEAGDRGAPVVVLAHGFPEIGYSWRHQLPALAAAGYHVLAPDQRGCGRSSAPEGTGDNYTMPTLAADLIGLLDDVGAQRGVFVGHGFGAAPVWLSGQLHPDRLHGIVGMSVPPEPRGPRPPTEMFRKTFGDNFFYMLYFQQPGPADADLGADAATTMRRMFALQPPSEQAAILRMVSPGPAGFVERLPEPGGLPDWISAAEFEHYVTEFTRSGFTGALNWYRGLDRTWEVTADVPQTIGVPARFVAGSADPVLGYLPHEDLQKMFTGDFREVTIDGAGHWLQQERPQEINKLLLDFLASVSPAG
ncbi:alpha/beta fold hydrolase [[Mycobacterium] zoologicum]|uniref:alpha/beta fold hydrolase n=1 Tax=[Mycobacterium] zoologicum TaxID=2872311 RepID=UPI001CDA89AD|nr:alpha/beta hydrolase [Mycolicibacter sp. MYC101]MEB3062396.1 alpha/beta hydrolase [Mycolicibacter sp. MYC101]